MPQSLLRSRKRYEAARHGKPVDLGQLRGFPPVHRNRLLPDLVGYAIQLWPSRGATMNTDNLDVWVMAGQSNMEGYALGLNTCANLADGADMAVPSFSLPCTLPMG